MLNFSAGWVRWSPPPPQHHNGILLGYKIQIKAGNSSKVLAQMTLNATTLSVMLNNLTMGAAYSIRVVGYTRVGQGPYSQPVPLVMDPSHVISPPRAHPSGSASATDENHKRRDLVHETWFMVLITAMLLIILISTAAAMLFFRRKHQLTKELGHLSGECDTDREEFLVGLGSKFGHCSVVPVVNANDITAINLNGKESLWIDRGWRAADTDKDSGLSQAKLLVTNSSTAGTTYTGDGGTDYAEVDTRNMSSFYNCRKVRVGWEC